MKHAGQVVTRTMLLENGDYHRSANQRHRRRLAAQVKDRQEFWTPLLHTVRGAGYTIRDSAH